MCAQSQIASIQGGVVIQISLPYIYDLSASLKPLNSLVAENPINSSIFVLLRAKDVLNGFLVGSIYSSAIKATRAPGIELLGLLNNVLDQQDKEQEIGFLNVFYITQALEKFETVLTAELNVGNAYWVSKKRGYDTSDLILNAEVLFPSDLISKVPECLSDIRDTGKCIAFELPTAAGFHVMRATEVVLRRFWEAVVPNGEPRPTTNNIGDYLRELDRLNAGSAKTRSCLRQIKDLHRNELIHPEHVLTLDEALGLLGIAQSIIVAMLAEIPDSLPPELVMTIQPLLSS